MLVTRRPVICCQNVSRVFLPITRARDARHFLTGIPGHKLRRWARFPGRGTLSASCGHSALRKKSLFDHLVGGREERLRNRKAERLARSHNRHRLTAAHHCRARQNRRFAPRLTLGLLELVVTYFVASL